MQSLPAETRNKQKRADLLTCSINFSGRWGARRPGDVCLAPTVAERRMNPWVQLTLPLLKQKKEQVFRLALILFQMRKMGLESFSAPRNPVKRRLTTSTPLGYLQGYLLSLKVKTTSNVLFLAYVNRPARHH